MANENVNQNLIDKFETALVQYGKIQSCVQPSNGHSWALGYILSMLKSGSFNEEEILYRLETFKDPI